MFEVTSATLTVPDADKCAFDVNLVGCGCQMASCVNDAMVRYSNGGLSVAVSGLPVSNGFGQPWGQASTYTTNPTSNIDQGYGSNCLSTETLSISLTFDDSQCGAPAARVHVVRGDGTSFDFTLSGDNYLASLGEQVEMHYGDDGYTQQNPDGSSVKYSPVTGMYESQTDAAGNVIKVVERAANGVNVTFAQRQAQTPDGLVIEQIRYEYDDPAAPRPLLMTATLTRQTDGDAWQNVSRVDYTYYGAGDAHGLPRDLRTAAPQLWTGSDWETTGSDYYRYYGSTDSSSSSSSGSTSDDPAVHLLKFALKPAAYDRMVADGHNPLTASDSLLAVYADYYYEYDDQRRVTKAVTKSGSQTYEFAYVASGFSDDVNHWKMRTTETLPDGNQNIFFTNYVGQTLLKVFQAGSDQWVEFWRYDANTKLTLHAHPSAISGYDEAHADLLNYDSGSGTYQYLRDNDGLIETYTYHAPSGNQASASLQQGQLGDSILQRSRTYCQCGSDCGCGDSSSSSSSSSGAAASGGVWFVASETVYPSDTVPSRTIVTSHCYSFFSGTCAVQQHVTTLPVVPTEQNGSGVADTNHQYFDTYGNLTWTMDERGFITRMLYDIPSGAMTQQIRDVDTGLYDDVPAGWSTPSGGGKNLVTDFEHDDRGRTIQKLGPSHTIDLDGTPTVIRIVSWTVYDDTNHVNYSGQGYATGTAPDYAYTLVAPVSMTIMDAGGRVNEQIQATAPSTSGTLAEIIDDAGGGAAAFPQASYTRWTTSQYTDCCLAASLRVYHDIPVSGAGASGTNYDETDYGYDVMKRRNRTVSPGGTITDVVYEPRGLVIATYVGTNDNGGTETDPTGGGSDPDNNMVIVSASEYDEGSDGEDGNLTEVTQHANSTTTRVTSMVYDFRNRKITTDGEVDYFEKRYYDNLNRVVKTERYDTTALGTLIARSETFFDDRDRVFRSIRYGVDPSTGTVGNSLTDNMWFDPSGNVIKSLPCGSSLFTKTTFDSLGRATVQYQGYDLNEASYADAFTLTDDVIMEQVETGYDDAGNVIRTTVRQRYHNAPDTQKGALQNPNTTPKARVTYTAAWQDGIGRTVGSANYGTDGGTALSRPETIPNASDTVLVSLSRFDDAGNLLETADPASMVTRFEYDDLGRKITQIDNYQADNSSSSSSSSSGDDCEPSDDTNCIIRYTYTPDGQQFTMTAENCRTGDQTTTWNYGTTLDNSDIAASQLLRSIAYPDSVSDSDVMAYSYNRQGQKTSLTDQRGCVHEFEYDKLGRQTHDRVTTVGDGVDDAVLRLSTTYEVRGMVETLTSWNNASVSSGDAINQCQFVYNTFQQLIADYQEHDGEVDTETTPVVQYGYEDGSGNTIRPITLTYPNVRVLNYDYGIADGINDAISRIATLIDDDGTTYLADYSFVGLTQFVVVDYTEPDVKYTLVNIAGTNDPDSGDIYSGWDRFGRVTDCRWYDYGHTTDVARLKYGYDRASDRLWRADLVAQSLSQDFDEQYSYDGLHRLKDMQRGRLNGALTAIADETFTQCWSLDSTTNWHGFREAEEGGSWTTVQYRTANTVNEITDIRNSVGSTWVTPAYDLAGNTTTIPQPADSTSSYIATYDAWNRIVQFLDDGSDNTVQKNMYDVRNFRVARFDYVDGILSETRHFYYSSHWESIEERLGSSPNSTNPERQHIWGQRYVDDLAVRDRVTDDNESLNERLYGLQDANWNVVAMIDTSATVQERYAYSPFGSPQILDGAMAISFPHSQVDNGNLFTGQRIDANIRLYLFRTRWYDPITGTFISRDLLMYPNGPNSYAGWFVPGDVDPTGMVAGAAAALALLGVLAVCGGPFFINAYVNYQTRSDKFLHCLVSCQISKHCTQLVAQFLGIAKEVRDVAVTTVCSGVGADSPLCKFFGGQGSYSDSFEDLLANQKCLYWEGWIPVANWIGALCRESCSDCCTREIGN